jgi:hypothetical protein
MWLKFSENWTCYLYLYMYLDRHKIYYTKTLYLLSLTALGKKVRFYYCTLFSVLFIIK